MEWASRPDREALRPIRAAEGKVVRTQTSDDFTATKVVAFDGRSAKTADSAANPI